MDYLDRSPRRLPLLLGVVDLCVRNARGLVRHGARRGAVVLGGVEDEQKVELRQKFKSGFTMLLKSIVN